MIIRPDKPIYPLMSIDPGKNALGWAYFGAGGFLTAAGVARTGTNHRPGGEDLGTVTRFLMRQLTEAWHGLMPARMIVIERMVVYKGPQQKGDPNDLIELSFISGAAVLQPAIAEDALLLVVPPREWKGQVPKETMVEHRIKPALQTLEYQLATASLQGTPDALKHNGWDAIGIGLWAQRRLK